MVIAEKYRISLIAHIIYMGASCPQTPWVQPSTSLHFIPLSLHSVAVGSRLLEK
jgi:hypothetical protein